MQTNETVEQLTLFGQDLWCGKTCPALSPAQTARTSGRSSKKPSELRTADYLFLDLRPGGGNLLGPCWEKNSPLLGAFWMLNYVKLHIIELPGRLDGHRNRLG